MMTVVVSDVNALIIELRARGSCRIGVDGVLKAGKTETATDIARELGVPHIRLDDYVEKNQGGGYVPYIDYAAVAEKVSSNQSFVIEGVCLLKILERSGLHLDCLIYIKRFSSGCWKDEGKCESAIDAAIYEHHQNIISAHELRVCLEGESYTPDVTNEPDVREEVMRYHAECQPHKDADIIFHKHVDQLSELPLAP